MLKTICSSIFCGLLSALLLGLPWKNRTNKGRNKPAGHSLVKEFSRHLSVQALPGKQLVCLPFLFCLLTACTLGGPREYRLHLGFNFFSSNPDMEVLDFQFGGGRYNPMAQMSEDEKHYNMARGGFGAFVYITKPEFVYVKWRNIQSGKIYEDRADLRGRLPDGIDGYDITFFVKESQLYVYLISPDRRPANWPKGPLNEHDYFKQWELYPNPTDFSKVKLIPSEIWR